MSKKLYLVGTVHTDLEGPRRLEGILAEASPEIIALEFSNEGEELVKRRKSLAQEMDEFKEKILNGATKEEVRPLMQDLKEKMRDLNNE